MTFFNLIKYGKSQIKPVLEKFKEMKTDRFSENNKF